MDEQKDGRDGSDAERIAAAADDARHVDGPHVLSDAAAAHITSPPRRLGGGSGLRQRLAKVVLMKPPLLSH